MPKFIEMKGVVILVKKDEMCNILKTVLATAWGNSHINVSSKQVLSKWMHFEYVLNSWELPCLTS